MCLIHAPAFATASRAFRTPSVARKNPCSTPEYCSHSTGTAASRSFAASARDCVCGVGRFAQHHAATSAGISPLSGHTAHTVVVICLASEQKLFAAACSYRSHVSQAARQKCAARADETGLDGTPKAGRSYAKLLMCVAGMM
jgi:hypothetical protein